MAGWNDRHLPHPLLAPWTDDYGAASFGAIVPHAVEGNGKHINFTIKYHLTSEALRDLFTDGSAQYLTVITCPTTSIRTALPTTQDEDVHVLEAGDYAGYLLLTPYVVAAQPIAGYTSEELADEFRHFRPDGFAAPAGSILAVGEETRMDLDESGSPESVIDLVSNPQVDAGLFTVDLEESRIKVYVSPEDKLRIESLRERGASSTAGATLFPSVYLHAVTEALRNLCAYSEDASWVRSIRQALEDKRVTVDDEILKENALVYAQKLMNKPVGTLLTAFANQEEE